MDLWVGQTDYAGNDWVAEGFGVVGVRRGWERPMDGVLARHDDMGHCMRYDGCLQTA